MGPGGGGGYARHVQLPNGRQRPNFITSCGLSKAIVIPTHFIVIPSEAEESEPLANRYGPVHVTKPQIQARPSATAWP